MRKLVLSAMALAMTVALVGCGEEKKSEMKATTTNITTTTTMTTTAEKVK